jgi:hypothetical protein
MIMTAGAAAAALVLLPAPAVAAPAPVDLIGLDFQVINGNSHKCLADSGDGRTLVQKACRRVKTQRWRFAPNLGGAFRIINAGTEKCLSGEGGRVVISGCDDASVRQWQLLNSKQPYGRLRNAGTGRCLTVAAGSTADGALAQQYTCDNRTSRRWTVRVVSTPFGAGSFTGSVSIGNMSITMPFGKVSPR